MVKRQIEGPNDDEILRFCYPQKSDETINPMKPNSKNLELKSGRNPCFKIIKKSEPNFSKNEEQFDLNDEINCLNII